MQSMIVSQQQLIRRSINSNHNNNDSNDNNSNNSKESLKSDSSSKETDGGSNSQTSSVQPLSDNNSSNENIETINNLVDIKKSGEKTKKRRSNNSWLNILNPTYKTRHEEFKRLFSDLVPNNERLVVDYSCALQKEILVQGRLYLSLNYISFYANIFKWETSLVIKCRDISALTKANTARVIPNAIQVVTTSGDKYVFTSFGARDKTYVMLFRIWQNALLDQPMSSAQLWQWVHYSYGEDLGLTSDDDEEYYSDHLVQTLTSQPQPIGLEIPDSNSSDPDSSVEREVTTECVDTNSISDCKCASHEGKLIMDTTFAVPIDRAFELIFTDNKFVQNLHKSRKTYDLCVTQWDDSTKDKKRQLNYTVALNHPLVKSARVIEKQILLEESAVGQCYSIRSEADNEGVPYSDAFSTISLWCLSKESEQLTRIRVHSEVVFKKNVWGLALMKPMIEKSSIQGITDYCTDLSKQLPIYLQMERNLGVVPHIAITELSVDLKPIQQLAPDSCDLNPAESVLTNHHLVSPSASKPKHKMHPILKSITSMSNEFLMKTILAVLLLTLVLNLLIIFHIWRIESQMGYSSGSASEQSQTAMNRNELAKLVDYSIEMIQKIESNLQNLKNRLHDEL